MNDDLFYFKTVAISNFCSAGRCLMHQPMLVHQNQSITQKTIELQDNSNLIHYV